MKHSGHPWRHIASATIFGILIMLAIGSTDSGSSSSSISKKESQRSTSTISGQRTITGDDYIGAIARADHDRLTNYAIQQDLDAFRSFLNAGLLAGTLTEFNQGERVFVADTAILSGLVKVRRQGETVEYWTNIEAVR